MRVWPFWVRINEVCLVHLARGPRSLPLDLPDLGQRFGTLTPCLLILGVWPFHHTAGPGPLDPLDLTNQSP